MVVVGARGHLSNVTEAHLKNQTRGVGSVGRRQQPPQFLEGLFVLSRVNDKLWVLFICYAVMNYTLDICYLIFKEATQIFKGFVGKL